MEQQTKYIDGKKLLANKKSIGVRLPQYLFDDLQAYSELTGATTTEVITHILTDFFRNKQLTDNEIIFNGSLYFKLPLNTDFKKQAIANKLKLNQELKTIGISEQITITTITNNLDVFNGNTYYAGSELAKENIKHIGLDFVIIPKIIKNKVRVSTSNNLDIGILDSLFVFYYEVTSVNLIDVYLINPIEAVNKLASVKSDISNKLVSCLQELENLEIAINNNYANEVKSNDGDMTGLTGKYFDIAYDLLVGLADKYNGSYIKVGSDATDHSIKHLNQLIEQYKTEQGRIKNIMQEQENEETEEK